MDAWDQYIRWARRLYELEAFQIQERGYKLDYFHRIKPAVESFIGGSGGLELIKKVTAGFNNVRWQDVDAFLRWGESHEDAARNALAALWGSGGAGACIRRFVGVVPADVIKAPAARINFCSVFLAAREPSQYMPFRDQPFRRSYELTNYPEPSSDADEGERYDQALSFLDRVKREAEQRGLTLRDRLDGQCIIWMMVKWGKEDHEGRGLSDEEIKELIDYAENYMPTAKEPTDDLAALVKRFKSEKPYPTDLDRQRGDERKQLGKLFERDTLKNLSAKELRPLAAIKGGKPGPMTAFFSVLNEPDGPARVAQAFDYLLYGDGDLANRLDELLAGSHRVSGVQDALLTKVLACRFPAEWVPVFPADGPRGKLACLDLLNLPLPVADSSRGAGMIEANDKLRKTLQPYFNEDTWGMMMFLYWLADISGKPSDQPEDGLAILADSLLLDVQSLRVIDWLLQDKKQVIFYGPPGTGKTFVARKLAEFYAIEPSKRIVIQFHPSYSYEDFIHGYRPEMVVGQMTFKLTDGPLKVLAKAAASDPDTTHLLLIDEINRGNLAKVFGELFYLLEYRDSSVTLQYSNASGFALPPNLWIIGTMNTADRSIALIDTALRRRFHFFPFFPDQPPIQDLLRRWIRKHKNGMEWVADVVDRANQELKNRQMAIGPSHFMRDDLSEDIFDRVWQYSVLPYIEEQFFDQPERSDSFDWKKLRSTNGDTIASRTD
jgi:MoxR-like ATPase